MMNVPAAVSFTQPLLARAVEIASVQPIVAHYCKLQAVEQILGAKLHLKDPTVEEFATQLMNEIEAERTTGKLAEAEAKEILDDDVACHAYVMNFANNVFDKARSQVEQRHVTKATGAGFLAASTFLSLEKMWNDPDEELQQKIRYAKYEATRILRAVKQGEDPNSLYQEPEVDQSELEIEGSELEANVQRDEADGSELEAKALQEQSSESGPGSPSMVLPSAPLDRASRSGTPEASGSGSHSPELGLPAAPASVPSLPFGYDKAPKLPSVSDFQEPARAPAPGVRVEPRSKPKPTSRADVKKIMDEGNTIATAQKHAKYAISALNYEDMGTAIAQLREALSVLQNYTDKPDAS